MKITFQLGMLAAMLLAAPSLRADLGPFPLDFDPSNLGPPPEEDVRVEAIETLTILRDPQSDQARLLIPAFLVATQTGDFAFPSESAESRGDRLLVQNAYQRQPDDADMSISTIISGICLAAAAVSIGLVMVRRRRGVVACGLILACAGLAVADVPPFFDDPEPIDHEVEGLLPVANLQNVEVVISADVSELTLILGRSTQLEIEGSSNEVGSAAPAPSEAAPMDEDM